MAEDFRDFYAAALPAVYRYVANRLNHDEDRAKDVTQETFLAIADRWPLPDGVANPIGWAIGVARNKLVDELRREERHRRRLVRHAVLQSRSAPIRDEPAATGRILHALSCVPPLQRSALILRHVDDLPVAEVAVSLGKSVRATESLLVRGRRSLATAYEELGDG